MIAPVCVLVSWRFCHIMNLPRVRKYNEVNPGDHTSVRPAPDESCFGPSDGSDRSEEKMNRNETVLEVTEALEGGYDARALGYGVFTQGEDWDDLKEMVRNAVRRHFSDGYACMKPSSFVRSHRGRPGE